MVEIAIRLEACQRDGRALLASPTHDDPSTGVDRHRSDVPLEAGHRAVPEEADDLSAVAK
jgi:hypothetical protein